MTTGALLKKIITVCIVAISVLNMGCATRSTMEYETYRKFSSLAAETQKCFEGQYISSQTYAEAKNALGYALDSWNYEPGKMNSMTQTAYYLASTSDVFCRQAEANARELTLASNQRRSDARENKKSLNDSIKEFNKGMQMNKPIFCERYGTSTICN